MEEKNTLKLVLSAASFSVLLVLTWKIVTWKGTCDRSHEGHVSEIANNRTGHSLIGSRSVWERFFIFACLLTS